MIQFVKLFIAFMEMAFSDNGIKFSFSLSLKEKCLMFDIVTAKTLLFLLGIFESKSFLQFVSIISNLSSNFRLNQSKA